MSVLPSVTNQNLDFAYFATLGNLSTSINPICAISSMRSDQIVLDGQTLDCTSANGGTLLVNGVALTSVTQNVSSVQNWAQFPALSSITYSGGGGTGGLINMATGRFSTINNTSSITAGNISATTVNSLNIQTGLSNVTGSSVPVVAATASVLLNTSNTFNFVSGADYLIKVPFAAAYVSPTFQGANVEGCLKFFGCSATAFPIIASGVTPGFSFTVSSAANSFNSIFGEVSFVATASATVTEALQLAVVPVGGLTGATVNATINATALSKIAVIRLT